MTAPAVDTNVASRFKVLERPNLSPGKCAVCGAVDRAVVDFGLNVWRFGQVMLCVTCVCEAAERVGMIRPETLEKDTLQSGQSVEDYLSAHGLRVVTNELHHALIALVGVCATTPAPSVNDVLDNLDDETTKVSPDQLELGFGDTESKSDEFSL